MGTRSALLAAVVLSLTATAAGARPNLAVESGEINASSPAPGVEARATPAPDLPRIDLPFRVAPFTQLSGLITAPSDFARGAMPVRLSTEITTPGPLSTCSVCSLPAFEHSPDDPLTREILRQSGPHKLTVVWLCDETASMGDDRARFRQRLARTGEELKRRLGEPNRRVGAVEHVVVGFGEGVHFASRRPLTDIEAVLREFDALPVDESGVEKTLYAVRAVIERYAPVDNGRRTVLFLVSDESGDDGESIEETLKLASARRVPVYVFGRDALFGAWRVRLRPDSLSGDPPVIRRGPETAEVEVLPWNGLGGREDERHSGFAPYGLGRLVKETGGIYFLLEGDETLRLRRVERRYTIRALQGYQPDLRDRSAYLASRKQSELHRTLAEIIEAVGVTPPLPLRLSAEPAPVRQAIDEADRRLGEFAGYEAKLRAAGPARDREPSKRWQANYDLMLAQVVSSRVMIREYRAGLEELSQRRPAGREEAVGARTWVASPSGERKGRGDEVEAGRLEAERLLRSVSERHPETPWADFAREILDRGLSTQWREGFPEPSSGSPERSSLRRRY